ncbi:hypothetical protein CDB79_RS18715 [Vibrio parahaemolyticus]|nr:hypothetical protein [Vibrio parahaemolyticus]EJG1743992.1 hypothetical protein [Vibrio parahaemolyticus]EJG1781705.1 hypothetical protein [Vibrio parahaemolyticus]
MFRSATAAKQIIMGHAVTSGPMFFAAEEGEPNEEGKGEYLHILVHIAGHPCEDVTHCWMNDEELGVSASSDPNERSFQHPNGNGWVHVYLGEQTEQLPLLKDLPDADGNMIGRGDTIAHIIMKSDPEKWPAGIPNVKFAVKGVKVHDPRTNETAWTDNPSLLLRWYRSALKHGSPIDDSYSIAANICDEWVETPDASYEKRYRCNYAFPCDENPRTVMANIRASCAGKSLSLIGRHGMTVGAYYGGATVTLTPSDIIGDLKTQPDVRRRDRINTVTATYLDPDSNWNEVDMPQFRHEGYYDLDGYEIVDDLDLQCCPSPYQAQRLSSIYLKNIREGATLDIPCNLKGFELLPGSTFKLDFPENGWDGVEFVVEKWKFAHEGGVTLSVRQHLASNYEFDGNTAKVPERPLPPTLHNPNQVEVITDLRYRDLVEDNTAQALITWSHRSYGGVTYRVKIYQNSILIRQEETKLKQYRLTDGFAVGTYLVEVSAINGYGISSPTVSLVFEAASPTVPIGCDIEAGNWVVTLSPVAGSETNFDTLYDFAFGFESGESDLPSFIIGRGRTLSIQNLAPNTEYLFAVREVSRWGVSDWFQTSFTTTNDPTGVLEVIRDKITHEHLNQELNDFLGDIDNITQDNSSAIEEVKQDLSSVGERLGDVSREQQNAGKELFNLTSQVHSFRDEYERRQLEGETLINAVVYRDPDSGLIVHRAYAYTDGKYTEAALLIDGVNANLALTAKKLEDVEAETGQRLTAAEAAILVNAGQIELKASHSEVNEIVAGALESITPAYSWQFNTSEEGWLGATWTNNGTITGTVFTRTDISFNADDNSVVRLRVKSAQSGTLSWNGGSQNITILQPGDSSIFETIIIKLTPADGWTGDITSLSIAMDAEFDSIEVGKPSAAELQLGDVTYRITQVEQELDPENARWGVYLTQDFWDANALTLTDVKQEIDGWNAQWKVTATLQQLSDNKTLEKANTASQWINASEANITQVVMAYNQQPGGVEDQLGEQADRLDTAEQQIDAQAGQISQVVTSLHDVENTLGEFGSLDELLDAYNAFLKEGEFSQGQVALSYAEQNIKAHSDELSSQAQRVLNLIAIKDQQQAAITRVEKVSADNTAAIAETEERLEAKITDGDEEILAQANTYTKSAVGYCVDANGNITNHNDAVLCVQAGHSWVDGPLANFIRNLTVQTSDGQSASVKQISQAFVQPNGTPVAKGGLVTDVNGKVSGLLNANNGQESQLDFIADHARFGVVENGAFLPLMYLDNTGRQMVVYGRMILGDGYQVGSVDDIRAQDGMNGAGMYTLTLRNGVFPANATATADFTAAYGRNPVVDDHLTYRNSAGTASSTKRFNGTGWVAPSLMVHGDLLATGTVSGNRFRANTEISAPIMRGGTGDFSGSLTAKDGSFVEKLNIGSAGGFTVELKSVTNSGHNVAVVKDSLGQVMFALQGNGQIYSIGGGFLNNLTIGENCTVLGTVYAEHIVGDILSAIYKDVPVRTDSSTVERNEWVSVFSATIKSQRPYLRTVILTGGMKAQLNLVSGTNGEERVDIEWRLIDSSGIVYSTATQKATFDGVGNKWTTVRKSQFRAEIPAGTPARDFIVQIRCTTRPLEQIRVGFDISEGTTFQEEVFVQLFKDSGELS